MTEAWLRTGSRCIPDIDGMRSCGQAGVEGCCSKCAGIDRIGIRSYSTGLRLQVIDR